MRNEDAESYPRESSLSDTGPTTVTSAEGRLRPAGKPAVLDEVLIEEVSIDGMCGVY